MIRNENYFVIHGWMINELNLSGNALLVYAIIFGFSQDGETEFSGSRKYICDIIGTTKPTVDRVLNELLEKDLIIKISKQINGITFNSYKVNYQNFTSGKKILPPSKEFLPNNNSNNNSNSNSLKEEYKEEINVEILKHWNDKNIIVHKSSNDILETINSTLKNNSKEEIMLAIDHYKEILDSAYFFSYKWSLVDFLKRKAGYKSFLNDGSNWVNYLEWKNNPKPQYNNSKTIEKKELSEFEKNWFKEQDEKFWGKKQ